MIYRTKGKFNNRMAAALISALLVVAMLIGLVLGSTVQADAYTSIGDSATVAPDITAEAGIVYCETSGKIIYKKNTDKVLYPYSITKILTAYLAVENLKLDDVVTISSEPPKCEENKIHLVEGEKITVKDLLYGALLYSGNDAACALGEAVAGSEEAFAEMMTEQAKEWGCKNTKFANASGWLDENHYTTVEDFLIIAKHCFANKTVAEISGTKEYTIPATNKSDARTIKTHVDLFSDGYPGVLRGKTGYWEDDDSSIVFQYEKDELKLIVILLKDIKSYRAADCTALLEYAHKAAKGYIVATPNEAAGKIWIRGGSHTHIDVYVDSEVKAYPKDEKESGIKTKITVKDGLKAPLKAGSEVGTLEVYTDGELTATRKLVVKADVKKGLLLSNIYISDAVFLCILIVIALCVIIIGVARRTVKKRKKRRRRMMEELMREDEYYRH